MVTLPLVLLAILGFIQFIGLYVGKYRRDGVMGCLGSVIKSVLLLAVIGVVVGIAVHYIWVTSIVHPS